ncbi:MAG: hypothetical protein ACFFDN_09825 [Candidatus Hodarchaeota archaeon]
MILKEDMEEAKERMKAWWDHEIIDRPVISYFNPRPKVPFKGIFSFWCLARNYDAIEECINDYETKIEGIYFGGENIPVFFPNYGPGIMAAVLGVIPEFKASTMWFNRPTDLKDIVSILESAELNKNNEWYSRLLRITEYAAKRASEKYQVAMTDLGGVLDILSSFLGPETIVIAIREQPELINTCRAIILEKLLKTYDALQNIIDKYCDGCSSWQFVWCHKHWYPIQSDISAIFSPKWFKQFVLPDIVEQAAHMDYAIYHLDGPFALKFLDDLLAAPEITGIQWVPGAGQPPDGTEKWMPVYKKIQKAGKNIIMDPPPKLVPHVYKELDPKGLFARGIFLSDSLAEFYLPTFIGGFGGELVQKLITWLKEHELTSLTRDNLKLFLSEKNIDVSKAIRRTLFQETKSLLAKSGANSYDLSRMASFVE